VLLARAVLPWLSRSLESVSSTNRGFDAPFLKVGGFRGSGALAPPASRANASSRTRRTRRKAGGGDGCRRERAGPHKWAGRAPPRRGGLSSRIRPPKNQGFFQPRRVSKADLPSISLLEYKSLTGVTQANYPDVCPDLTVIIEFLAL
jgi:hypothetical protein